MTEIYGIVRKLHDVLGGHIILYQSTMIYQDIEVLQRSRKDSLNNGLIKQAVDAICTHNSNLLKHTLLQILGDMISQSDFMWLMERIIKDEKLTVGHESFQSDVSVEDIEEALSNVIDCDQLCDALLSILLDVKSDSKRPMKNIVEEIEKYLISNYNRKITQDILSAKFGFVPSYLSKIFRAYKGASPSEFLVQYRIQKAKGILESRCDILVRDVAETVGYDNSSHFSRVFKKETGLWPKEYMDNVHGLHGK
jgi:YesN/AraC family two-component response regulator